jgi:hypothetical protein
MYGLAARSGKAVEDRRRLRQARGRPSRLTYPVTWTCEQGSSCRPSNGLLFITASLALACVQFAVVGQSQALLLALRHGDRRPVERHDFDGLGGYIPIHQLDQEMASMSTVCACTAR